MNAKYIMATMLILFCFIDFYTYRLLMLIMLLIVPFYEYVFHDILKIIIKKLIFRIQCFTFMHGFMSSLYSCAVHWSVDFLFYCLIISSKAYIGFFRSINSPSPPIMHLHSFWCKISEIWHPYSLWTNLSNNIFIACHLKLSLVQKVLLQSLVRMHKKVMRLLVCL